MGAVRVVAGMRSRSLGYDDHDDNGDVDNDNDDGDDVVVAVVVQRRACEGRTCSSRLPRGRTRGICLTIPPAD